MCSLKKSITVYIFEDKYLEDGEEFVKHLDSASLRIEGAQEYSLAWHPTYNAIGQIKGALIRSLDEYREAVDFVQSKLEGEAILFLDLELQDDLGRKFIISKNEVNQDLFAFMKCYAGVDSIESGLLKFNPKNLGLCLAFAAAKNEAWHGVVCFTSQQDIVDLDHLRRCLSAGDRIQWLDPRRALKGGSALVERLGVVDRAIECLIRQSAGPAFWSSETSEWFKCQNSPIPHDAPPDPALRPDVVKEIKNYLTQLLGGFNPPNTWFEPPQWEILYESLKGLMGACAVCSGGAKNLRLPSIPLLLAAQMASKKNDIKWLESYEWDSAGLIEIMDHKDKSAAREAIRSMAVFLEHLGSGNDGTQVIGAKWGPLEDMNKHLLIDFRMDPLKKTTGVRSLLQTVFGSRWGNGKGQTVSAYEKMMENARRPPPYSSPKFSLCIYPMKEPDSNEYYTRLDFSIAPA